MDCEVSRPLANDDATDENGSNLPKVGTTPPICEPCDAPDAWIETR